MNEQSLETLLQNTSPVKLLRNSASGPNAYPVVASEYTNWRDEQQAWQKSCILFNQSYHMTDMFLEGPDALKLLSDLGINTFKNFGPNKAKQYIPCNYDGYVIGDVILFGLEPNVFNLVGRPSVHNWVQYHCETGGYKAKLTRDERAAVQKGPVVTRKTYRYQVQGPNALKLMEKQLGGSVPEVKFFQMAVFTIAGKSVRALRHGMVGQPGFELFGPWWPTGKPSRRRSSRFTRSSGRGCAGARGVFFEHAGIRLDPFASARHLHRREDEGLP